MSSVSKVEELLKFSFFYCCSIIVFPPFLHCSSLLCTHYFHSQSPRLPMPMSPLFMFFGFRFPLLNPIIPLPPPLWSLLVWSLFSSLWFYFAHLFVLFICFHLEVRLYGICLSLPSLFHLIFIHCWWELKMRELY